MSDSIDQRRAQLSATIARQRGELAQAYVNLAKPIQYAEQGLRGFGFLRANPWVLTAVPAVFSITGTVVNLLRNKPAKPKARAVQSLEREVERKPKDLKGHIVTWGGRGWKLFQLYRRYRKYLVP